MPELPEIEVLRRSLSLRILGRTVVGVEVSNPALREPVNPEQLARAVVGRRIVGLGRRAKYLLIDLDGEHSLVVHLGMSGQLTLVDGDEPKQKHEHVAFHLDDGRRLRFRDPRRFGLVLALPTEGLLEDRHFSKLGPEPLAGALTGELLAATVGRRRGAVKNFLMDGSIVVGVGNIYASEALYRAGIHPNRSVARISPPRWEALAAAVRATLEAAIAEGGTTLKDFADGDGNSGYFQVSLAVYDREGEPCPRCAKPIRRMTHSGRGTFYCGGCQR